MCSLPAVTLKTFPKHNWENHNCYIFHYDKNTKQAIPVPYSTAATMEEKVCDYLTRWVKGWNW
jgi:hypothetical protein